MHSKRMFTRKSLEAFICGLIVFCAGAPRAAARPAVFSRSQEIRIAEKGEALTSIVVPDGAGAAEIFAAEELRKYIRKISGAEPEIIPEGESGRARSRVLVGGTTVSREKLAVEFGGLAEDAFAVGVIAGDLLLAGAGDRGTVYAVYDFLERELGCRWLGVGELWEHVPAKETLRVRAEARLEKPAMLYRSSGLRSWAIKNKSNMGESVHQATTLMPFEWLSERYRRAMAELPIGIAGWARVHSAPHDLIPGYKTVQDYPEWFALQVDGSRHQRWLCYSNPEVTDLLADRLSQILREKPHMDFAQASPGDWIVEHYCRCGGCMELDVPGGWERSSSAGVHTHRVYTVMNRVAENLAERAPGRKLLVDAYSSYQEPPDPDVVVLDDNVMVEYYTWRAACRMHGYGHDPGAAAGTHALQRKWIEEWTSQAPGGVITAEYLKKASMDGMVGTNPRRFVRDMRYLHRKGAVGYTAFGGHSTFGLEGINSYAAAKAMWNPYLDEDELVRDYCDHAFHEASEHMQAFINTIEGAMGKAPCSRSYVSGYMAPGVMAGARRHLDAAHAAAEGNELVRERLLTWEAMFGYQELAGPAYEKILGAVMGVPSREWDAGKIREAIELGEKALEYRDRLREEHPGLPWIPFGHALDRNLREGGSWRQWLRRAER